MRLSYLCSFCKGVNYLKEKAEIRVELKMKLNKDEIEMNCKACGKANIKHINRIDAVVDRRITIIGLVFGVLGTILMWQLGFIGAFTFLIPILFWKNEMENTSRFNKTTIRR